MNMNMNINMKMNMSTWGGLRNEFLFHPDLSSPDLNILFIRGQKKHQQKSVAQLAHFSGGRGMGE